MVPTMLERFMDNLNRFERTDNRFSTLEISFVSVPLSTRIRRLKVEKIFSVKQTQLFDNNRDKTVVIRRD